MNVHFVGLGVWFPVVFIPLAIFLCIKINNGTYNILIIIPQCKRQVQ